MEKTNIIDYTNAKYYENRELSWIMFDKRVLSEALDDENPLFERLKFLGISAHEVCQHYILESG